jgi:hypothetical protein
MLPALSRSLDGALVNSELWVRELRCRAIEVFQLAAKLRNPLLFREALVWVTGPHNKPFYHDIDDRQLRMIAQCAHAKVLQLVSDLTQLVI